MIKKLFKIAAITSPILAIYGTAPFYIFNQVDFYVFSTSIILLSLLIFALWNINIFIFLKFNYKKSWKRYLLSYAVIFIAHIVLDNVREVQDGNRIDFNLLYPFLTAFAINSIIIIIINSIMLQFEKKNTEIEIQKLKVSNIEAQKQVLIKQLQPHFLFNTLSTLKSLISKNPKDAEDYTVRLSDFLRYSIQAQNRDLIDVADELKFTQDYIELQKMRFGDALKCTIHLPSFVLSQQIPIYALQTLVENAVKHNGFTAKKPLNIVISVEKNQIRVENNKNLKKARIESGTGLQNLNKRYKLLGAPEINIVDNLATYSVFINLIKK